MDGKFMYTPYCDKITQFVDCKYWWKTLQVGTNQPTFIKNPQSL